MTFRLAALPQPSPAPKITAGEVVYHRDEPVFGRVRRAYHNGFASCLELEGGQWDYTGKWKRTLSECNWNYHGPAPAAGASGDRQQRASVIFWWAGLVENYNAGAEVQDQLSEYAFYLMCRDDADFKTMWAPSYDLATLNTSRLDDNDPTRGN